MCNDCNDHNGVVVPLANKKNYDRFQAANNTAMTFDQYVQAIHQGNKKALDEAKANARVQLTNPSAIAPRGKGH